MTDGHICCVCKKVIIGTMYTDKQGREFPPPCFWAVGPEKKVVKKRKRKGKTK